MNAKRVSAEAVACQRPCLHVPSVSVEGGLASRSAKVDVLRRVSPKLCKMPRAEAWGASL